MPDDIAAPTRHIAYLHQLVGEHREPPNALRVGHAHSSPRAARFFATKSWLFSRACLERSRSAFSRSSSTANGPTRLGAGLSSSIASIPPRAGARCFLTPRALWRDAHINYHGSTIQICPADFMTSYVAKAGKVLLAAAVTPSAAPMLFCAFQLRRYPDWTASVPA